MSVYVDTCELPFGRMIMCHMIADTPMELHAMADAIGMKRAWYQSLTKASFPHYDLAKSRRAEAVKRGAIELDRPQFCGRMAIIKLNTDAIDWE